MIVFTIASVWHALIAKSICNKKKYKNALFILEPSSRNVYECIKKIIKDEKLIFLGEKKAGLKAGVEVLKLRLFPGIKLSNVKKIYYFCPWSPYQRVYCHLAKSAKIIRVEDGIRDYLDIPFDIRKKSLVNKLIKRLIFIDKFYDDDHSLYYKESEFLAFFPDKLPVHKGFPNCTHSLINYKRELISILKQLPIATDLIYLSASEKKRILFIGQSLSEDGAMTLGEEVEVYMSYMHRVLKNEVVVVFKPHPRTSKEKKEAILECTSRYEGQFIYIDTPDMVEQLLIAYKFSEVVGMWSIPILYSSFLFDIKAKTLMREASDKVADAHIKSIHSSLKRTFSNKYYCEI